MKHWLGYCYVEDFPPLSFPLFKRLQSRTKRHWLTHFFFFFWLSTIIKCFAILSQHESTLVALVLVESRRSQPLSVRVWPLLEFKWICQISARFELCFENVDGDFKSSVCEPAALVHQRWEGGKKKIR